MPGIRNNPVAAKSTLVLESDNQATQVPPSAPPCAARSQRLSPPCNPVAAPPTLTVLSGVEPLSPAVSLGAVGTKTDGTLDLPVQITGAKEQPWNFTGAANLQVSIDGGAALTVAVEVEQVAEIYWRALAAGEPVILDDAEMARVVERFKDYGRPR